MAKQCHIPNYRRNTIKYNLCNVYITKMVLHNLSQRHVSTLSWAIFRLNTFLCEANHTINNVVFFHANTVHLDIIKVLFIHQLRQKWTVLKIILKFALKLTLKQLRRVSVQSHHQGAHYSCLLKLWLLTLWRRNYFF